MVEPKPQALSDLYRNLTKKLEDIDEWDNTAAKMVGKSFGKLLKYVSDKKEKSAEAVDCLRKFAETCN
jgi:hypothetical protein